MTQGQSEVGEKAGSSVMSVIRTMEIHQHWQRPACLQVQLLSVHCSVLKDVIHTSYLPRAAAYGMTDDMLVVKYGQRHKLQTWNRPPAMGPAHMLTRSEDMPDRDY